MKTAVTLLGLRFAGLLAAGAAAGTGPDTQSADPRPTPSPAPTMRVVADPVRTAADTGALLREGSYLLRTKGSLHRDADSGWWRFRVAPGDPHQQIGELTLLPCSLLENLEQLIESTPPQQRTIFDLSGQVFGYRGRNYLLPTHAPRLVEYVPPPPVENAPGMPQDNSARDILRELEQTVGPVLRSSRTGRPPDPDGEHGTQKLLPPGTVILWRRGWLVRGNGGAWSFVFEADASGLVDPPMILLPCLLLEEMERHGQRGGSDPALLISGRVERYHARNYLLPTSYQVPRHHTPLRP
ncbi:MAG: hypothetical protein ACYS1E_19995 [Planctomycetota bacterium]